MPKAGHKQFLVGVSWIWFFSISDSFNRDDDDSLAVDTKDVGFSCSLVECLDILLLSHNTVGEERDLRKI